MPDTTPQGSMKIEDYLAETCRGNRTAAHYVRALRWAGVTKALKG